MEVNCFTFVRYVLILLVLVKYVYEAKFLCDCFLPFFWLFHKGTWLCWYFTNRVILEFFYLTYHFHQPPQRRQWGCPRYVCNLLFSIYCWYTIIYVYGFVYGHHQNHSQTHPRQQGLADASRALDIFFRSFSIYLAFYTIRSVYGHHHNHSQIQPLGKFFFLVVLNILMLL